MGELWLLQWLIAPAPLETIYQRQQAVMELHDKVDFRERMAVSGNEVEAGVAPEALRQWATSPSGSMQGWMRWVALVLAALALCATFAWLQDGTRLPLLAVLLVELCVARYFKDQMTAVMRGTDNSLKTLELFSALFREIEREDFQTKRLIELKRDLLSHETSASAAIDALGKIVSYKNTLSNPLLKPFDLLLMYSVQLAFAIQRWRKLHGEAVPVWLDALGEMEALLSIAAYSYEHPDDPFPTFTDGPAHLDMQEVGHPLIPASSCVRNSVTIGGTTRVLLISGSNMSGKSTLMRTVGVNVVLAMCGAPVRARRMELTPVTVGASLVVNDSLLRGKSRFYAEIEKIQAICELARKSELPVLFLLDELLQGTNSNDRLLGAAGITQELVDCGAIGILTTHDLSLTAIEKGEGWIKNAHFQDFIVEGEMRFDFRLRDGVVTKSNGVELMRLIGLKV
ncbi:MutS-related protein [Terriglobus roseus]|nr:mismatch repair protein [Terriglobus roseus]